MSSHVVIIWPSGLVYLEFSEMGWVSILSPLFCFLGIVLFACMDLSPTLERFCVCIDRCRSGVLGFSCFSSHH